MKVTTEELLHIAELSRLKIRESEIGKITSELEDILTYVDKLNELDTTGILPMEHVVPINNIFRDDFIVASLPRQDILFNSPERDDEYFFVPQVVE